MRALTESQAGRVNGAALLAMANKQPLVVNRKGRPSWAVVPLKGLDLEAYIVSNSPVFRRIIARSKRRLKTEGGVSLQAVKKCFGIK